jgi:DNA-directed RNA polymerase subunit RPC12/RpoP
VNARVKCPRCNVNFIVMPSELYKAVGDLGGIEGEVQFREQLKVDKAKTGDRLAVADVDRFYACPECGERGQLPPEDELRRLAEEQADDPPA